MNASTLHDMSWRSCSGQRIGLLEWDEQRYELNGPFATVPRPYDEYL